MDRDHQGQHEQERHDVDQRGLQEIEHRRDLSVAQSAGRGATTTSAATRRALRVDRAWRLRAASPSDRRRSRRAASMRSRVSATARGNIEKADPAVKEGGHRDLVGRVHGRRRAAARRAAPARARSRAGKRSGSGASKVSGADGGQVQPRRRPGQPVGPGEGAGDRARACPAGRAGPGSSRRRTRPGCGSIDCGWTRTSIRSGGRGEQVGGLDHLQALVHHGGGIDRDLGAHRPVGMGDGLLRRGRRPSASRRPGAERPAGGGEDQARRPAAAHAGLQHLEDGRVLGIDRDHRAARRPGPCAAGPGRRRPGSPCWPGPRSAPARAAARVGARPATPTMADMTQSAPTAAASATAAAPAAASMPVPARRSRSSGSRRLVGDHRELRAASAGPARPAARRCGRRSGRRPRPRAPAPGRRAGRGSRPRPSRWSPGR